eukprot:SAG31_NODE_1616_length_7734_cov_3.954813_5_plen_182_part_00
MAAEFLLRVQQPNGDFLASVFDARTSAVVRGPTFAATTSAILLWAKLFEVTGDKTWLTAAEACAAAVSRNYLSPGEFQIDGGELDNVMTKNHLHANSAGCYGVMGLSALAIVTQNETHIQLVRVVMDYMLAQREWISFLPACCRSAIAISLTSGGCLLCWCWCIRPRMDPGYQPRILPSQV